MTQQFNFNTQLHSPPPPLQRNRIAVVRDHVKNWWYTVDRFLLIFTIVLVFFGTMMSLSASAVVAKRIGIETWATGLKQFGFALPTVMGMVVVSCLSVDWARRLAIVGFLLAVVLLGLLPFVGTEIKGAKRWIYVFGVGSIQPTELLKPTFVVVSAWFLSAWRLGDDVPGHWIAGGLFVLSLGLIAIQPDLGQSLLFATVFLMQIFVLGIPLWWTVVSMVLILAFFGFMYVSYAHVRDRIDQWLNPEPYSQMSHSLQAFGNGGWLGKGLGNGQIKMNIPDAHTDFIFAVIGEELGLLPSTALIVAFLFICHRCMGHLRQEKNLFIILSAGGLVWLFIAQAFVNMASTINIIPTKGMTLPFISSGISSLVGTCLGMGLILSFTRKRTFF